MVLANQLHEQIESLQNQISQLQVSCKIVSNDIKGQAKIKLLKMRLIYLRQTEDERYNLREVY